MSRKKEEVVSTPTPAGPTCTAYAFHKDPSADQAYRLVKLTIEDGKVTNSESFGEPDLFHIVKDRLDKHFLVCRVRGEEV